MKKVVIAEFKSQCLSYSWIQLITYFSYWSLTSFMWPFRFEKIETCKNIYIYIIQQKDSVEIG